MQFWQKINQAIWWITLAALPFSIRKVILPVWHGSEFVDYVSVSLYLSDLLLICLLLTWWWSGNQRGWRWGPWLITAPLLAVLVWMWCSAFWATSPGQWQLAIVFAARLTLASGLYFYIVNRVKDVTQLVYPISIGAVLQGLIGLGQYWTNHSLGLKWLGESVLDPNQSGIPVVMRDGWRQLRAHGTLPHANVLGGFLAFSSILSWPKLALAQTGAKVNGWWGANLSMLVGLILSFSRSAWVMFLVAGGLKAVWLLTHRSQVALRQLWSGWWVAMILAGLVISQWGAISSRVMGDNQLEQISISAREQQWQEFRTIYGSSPIVGVGAGQYFWHLWQPTETGGQWGYRSELGGWSYSASRTLPYYQPVHNVYLLILAELGPIGLAGWLWLLVGAIGVAVGLLRKHGLWAIAGLGGLGLIVGVGGADHYLWTLPVGQLIFMLGVSFVAGLWANTVYKEQDGKSRD